MGESPCLPPFCLSHATSPWTVECDDVASAQQIKVLLRQHAMIMEVGALELCALFSPTRCQRAKQEAEESNRESDQIRKTAQLVSGGVQTL